MFHQTSLKVSRLPLISYVSFEFVCVRLQHPSVLFVVIYRPGSSQVTELFFDEFADLLERTALGTSPVIIAGDLNVHLDIADDRAAVKLSHVLQTYGLTQHISQPTHVCGHTHDVFITRSDQSIEAVNVDPPLLSDHSLIVAPTSLLKL